MLEIGQSDVVPQYLHPESLPRADDRESLYRPLEKGGGKGRAGHNRGKRQAEDLEKSNMDFLRKFSETSLVEPEIAPNTALVNGVWQSDGSRHTLDRQLTRAGDSRFTMTLAPQNGMPTIRVAYFYAGPDRKCTIGRSLWKLCKSSGHGLAIEGIDIFVGGKS